MTRFTVTWHREAEVELADLWLEASDRDEIVEAVRTIDVALCSDADSKGAAVSEGLRSLNVPPLRVLFLVRESDRIVQVALVRRMGRAGRSGMTRLLQGSSVAWRRLHDPARLVASNAGAA